MINNSETNKYTFVSVIFEVMPRVFIPPQTIPTESTTDLVQGNQNTDPDKNTYLIGPPPLPAPPKPVKTNVQNMGPDALEAEKMAG
jgi:hypothetical protein